MGGNIISSPCSIQRVSFLLRFQGAMGSFPPMSNSKITDRAGTFGVDAFSTFQERLSRDQLAAELEEEMQTALDEILTLFQIGRSRSRQAENVSTVEVLYSFSPKGSFF